MRAGVISAVRGFMENQYLDFTTFNKLGIAFDVFLEMFREFDDEMCNGAGIDTDKRHTRNKRCSYCYILCNEIHKNTNFGVFCLKGFYGGKGKDNRCYSHLLYAKDIDNSHVNMCGKKLKIIVEEWKAGEGIHVVRGFESSTQNESFNREAAIIEFLGIDKIANKNRGTLKGDFKNWAKPKLHNYGLFLMYTLYMKTINENIKPVCNNDISVKITREKKIFKKCMCK